MYDVIVVGCGSAGLTAGLFLAKTGLKILMVSESERNIGGDCLNDGCVPSKALIHVAKIAHNAGTARQFGLTVSGQVELEKAMKYVKDSQETIRVHENAAWLKQQGADVAIGRATFVSKNEIEIAGCVYKAKKLIIATGSRPRLLDIPGSDEVTVLNNESIFKLKHLPKKLLVVGGGPIGVEMAQAFARLGSLVTILTRGDTLLPNDDTRVTSILTNQLKKEGITVKFNSEPKSFESPRSVLIADKNGQTQLLEFDEIFVAIGRLVNIDTLNPEKAGIKTESNQLVLNQYLQTTNKDVFACGDAAGQLMFSHVAEYHGRIILNNIFSPFKKAVNYDHLSWVTFTDPEIATFGLSEKELVKRKIKYETLEQLFEDDDRAVTDNYRFCKAILFIKTKTIFTKPVILGGTMIAPGAGEIIQELILANKEKLSVDTLFNKIYPYPVAARINQKLIVEHKAKGLTNFVKKILRISFKLFN